MFSLKIGQYTYLKDIINPLEVPIIIGKFCSISFHLNILGEDHACISVPEVVTTYPFDALWQMPSIENQKIRGGIVIGNDVWIGMNVSIRPGVTIGDGAIVGAGSIVTKNVEPYEIVSGNPIKHMRYRFSMNEVRRLLEVKWWDWSEEKIKNNIDSIYSITKFMEGNFKE